MTGKELIEWIIEHKAEEYYIVIAHRDEGGFFQTGERLGELEKPQLGKTSNEEWGIIRKIEYTEENPCAIIL